LPKDYLSDFPIPEDQLPELLRSMLEPVGEEAQHKVIVAKRHEHDPYGPTREHLHMLMACVPEDKLEGLRVLQETSDGLVSSSTPYVQDKGECAEYVPSVSGFDYVVAAWGDGSFFSYNLAEKVWMSLGLSPRCIGGEHQRISYDDFGLPEFGVAEGEISTEYFYSSKRNVQWVMSNEYLRRYLWMRGSFGVRVFFYEALLPDTPELRSVMEGAAHFNVQPEGGWYELGLREHNGGLLIQVWASVIAVSPELCSAPDANGLVWPGVEGSMTHDRANALVGYEEVVYLDDRFLERYEQSDHFDTMPVNAEGRWLCSPSYKGQWSFSDLTRVGRNMVSACIRELYKPKPDREIVHAHSFALEPALVGELDHEEEHVAAKVERLADQLLSLGDHLAALSEKLGISKAPTEIVGFSRAEIAANGWYGYPELSRLAQVAPLSMTEQAFLTRCKSLYEIWQRIPNSFLRQIVRKAGHSTNDVKGLGSLKLLQALSNIAERLNTEGDDVDSFDSDPEIGDLTERNPALAPLFINNELRIADAHDAGGVLAALESIGFDVAALNEGYGRALDTIFDEVISAFAYLNGQLEALIE
jgi:hypothetical protein